MKQNKFIAITTIIIVSLFILTDPSFKFFNNGFLSKYEMYMEPLFLLSISSLVSALLIFVKRDLFKKWFQKFFIWYFPVTLLLTFAFPTSGYTMPHRFDVTILFGIIMVLVTLGMVGYSFYRRK